MTVLVAGNAALHDILFTADRLPASSQVAALTGGPGTEGRWLPGGATFAIALALRGEGLAVRVWHPLPIDPAAFPVQHFAGRGIDLSPCPPARDPFARCIMIDSPAGRLAWSSRGDDVVPADLDALLDGVSHVVIAPAWGEWAESIVRAARAKAIPCSLIGEATPATHAIDWDIVVIDRPQRDAAPDLRPRILAVTRGAEGATIEEAGVSVAIAAAPAAVVDPTGAGDTFGGALVARILCGDDLAQAGKTAAIMAARACEAWGTFGAFAAPAPVAGAADQAARARGALAGTACGDAFGMPNSFLTQPIWRTRMEPGPANSPYHADYPAGRITDDTEQALALTDALEQGFAVATVAARLNDWFVSVGGSESLAVGPSTKRALMAFQAGENPMTIGRTGVTNGAAMRIAPIGVYAGLRGLSLSEAADLVATACWPTHATTPAISGAMAAAWAIAVAVRGAPWEEIVDAALDGAREGSTRGHWIYAPDIAGRIAHACGLAKGAHSPQALARLVSEIVGAGEPTTETLPAAMAIADYAQGNPALAIEIAGNLRGDTDTIAAIAGAICGAYAGDEALPAAWRSLVEEVNALDMGAWSQRLADAPLIAITVPASA